MSKYGDTFDKAKAKATEAAEDLGEKAGELGEKAKETAEGALGKAKDVAEDVRDKIPGSSAKSE